MNPPDRVRELLDRLAADRRLEDHCARCGDCCHFAVKVQLATDAERFLIEGLPCRFLERTADGRHHCSVYRHRSERASWCGRDVQYQLEAGLSSGRCGFVRDAPWYKGSEVLTPERIPQFLPQIRNKLPVVAWTLAPGEVDRFASRWKIDL